MENLTTANNVPSWFTEAYIYSKDVWVTGKEWVLNHLSAKDWFKAICKGFFILLVSFTFLFLTYHLAAAFCALVKQLTTGGGILSLAGALVAACVELVKLILTLIPWNLLLAFLCTLTYPAVWVVLISCGSAVFLLWPLGDLLVFLPKFATNVCLIFCACAQCRTKKVGGVVGTKAVKTLVHITTVCLLLFGCGCVLHWLQVPNEISAGITISLLVMAPLKHLVGASSEWEVLNTSLLVGTLSCLIMLAINFGAARTETELMLLLQKSATVFLLMGITTFGSHFISPLADTLAGLTVHAFQTVVENTLGKFGKALNNKVRNYVFYAIVAAPLIAWLIASPEGVHNQGVAMYNGTLRYFERETNATDWWQLTPVENSAISSAASTWFRGTKEMLLSNGTEKTTFAAAFETIANVTNAIVVQTKLDAISLSKEVDGLIVVEATTAYELFKDTLYDAWGGGIIPRGVSLGRRWFSSLITPSITTKQMIAHYFGYFWIVLTFCGWGALIAFATYIGYGVMYLVVLAIRAIIAQCSTFIVSIVHVPGWRFAAWLRSIVWPLPANAENMVAVVTSKSSTMHAINSLTFFQRMQRALACLLVSLFNIELVHTAKIQSAYTPRGTSRDMVELRTSSAQQTVLGKKDGLYTIKIDTGVQKGWSLETWKQGEITGMVVPRHIQKPVARVYINGVTLEKNNVTEDMCAYGKGGWIQPTLDWGGSVWVRNPDTKEEIHGRIGYYPEHSSELVFRFKRQPAETRGWSGLPIYNHLNKIVGIYSYHKVAKDNAFFYTQQEFPWKQENQLAVQTVGDLENGKVTPIVAQLGSGKSTTLIKDISKMYGADIVVAEPSRATTYGLYSYMSVLAPNQTIEMDIGLKKVKTPEGTYRIQADSMSHAERRVVGSKKITYCTTGKMLSQIITSSMPSATADRLLKGKVLVLDEIHVQDGFQLSFLGMAASFKCPIVTLTATPTSGALAPLARYGTEVPWKQDPQGIEIPGIKGRLEMPPSKCRSLIFVASVFTTISVAEEIKRRTGMETLAAYSDMSEEDRQRIPYNDGRPLPSELVVVSTSYLQTGVTLNLHHVFDTCLMNRASSPSAVCKGAIIKTETGRATQAEAAQNSGRIGRFQIGTYHPAVPRQDLRAVHGKTVDTHLMLAATKSLVGEMCSTTIAPDDIMPTQNANAVVRGLVQVDPALMLSALRFNRNLLRSKAFGGLETNVKNAGMWYKLEPQQLRVVEKRLKHRDEWCAVPVVFDTPTMSEFMTRNRSLLFSSGAPSHVGPIGQPE